MSDSDTIDQVCYTVNSPEADWLAEYLHLPVHGMWFGAFGIVRTSNRRVANLALNPVQVPGESPGTIGYDGVSIEIFNIDTGSLVKQTLLFRDYVPRTAKEAMPALVRHTSGRLVWSKRDDSFKPELTHLVTAIMALIDVFSPADDGGQERMTTILQRHRPGSAASALEHARPTRPTPLDPPTTTSFRPMLPRGHTDPEQEPIIIEDER
jgi:hypothetical protein